MAAGRATQTETASTNALSGLGNTNMKCNAYKLRKMRGVVIRAQVLACRIGLVT